MQTSTSGHVSWPTNGVVHRSTFHKDFRPSHVIISACKQSSARVMVVVLVVFTFLALNVLSVVLPSMLTSRCRGSHVSGLEQGEVVAPLCMPCEDRMTSGVVTFDDADNGGKVCCPTSYFALVDMIDELYSDVLREKLSEKRDESDNEWTFSETTEESGDVSGLMFTTNSRKPLGHVTGLQAVSSTGDRKAGDALVLAVSNSPSSEPYRTVTVGDIKRLTWGLEASVNGTYRVHSSVNFFFQHNRSLTDSQAVTAMPVIHQLSRYDVMNKQETTLAKRNQTVSSRHCDGLSSFLMTSARLNAGDVIFVQVSHPQALVSLDRWHTQDLLLLH
ncbi:uncharacterized protein LOC112555273 [Pomacea canaliculata]|uniref:uncharacterized protein LOC112555273 n=1 Tax=Pomacea canaliculata TaxID=400727 RepID=UPI000D725EC3|nr:uncharacterized protein LOC112555273 [Pomacea canaliculata]XP_025079388.1 uncharacterized protein LOC112555273 [Pomacea canaliculata]